MRRLYFIVVMTLLYPFALMAWGISEIPVLGWPWQKPPWSGGRKA